MSGVIDDVHMRQSVADALLAELRESSRRTTVTGKPDPEALAALRRSGLLAIAVPRECGGRGCAATEINWVIEQVASANPSVAIILFQHCAVSARIAEWGSEAQRAELLPPLADGTWLAASAWSEKGAGAAKLRMGTTGVRTPDGWLLNGEKSFTTGASIADLYLVLAQTDDAPAQQEGVYGGTGQTFFLVRGDNPGLVPELSLDLVGMRGSATGFVSLRDCVVRAEDRLGEVGCAAAVIASVRESGVTLGAVAVGVAQAAVGIALAHVNRRGLDRSESVRHRLVELITQVEAARAIVVRAGQRCSADPGRTTLQSKLFASTVAEQVCLEVGRLLGSAGYLADAGLNPLLADVRAVALMGPTNDLCRDLVAESGLR